MLGGREPSVTTWLGWGKKGVSVFRLLDVRDCFNGWLEGDVTSPSLLAGRDIKTVSKFADGSSWFVGVLECSPGLFLSSAVVSISVLSMKKCPVFKLRKRGGRAH